MKNEIEIFVVFGKELKNDRMTFEYKDRIDCMIENLDMKGYFSNKENMVPNGSKILFTGGRKNGGSLTEAGQGQDYFKTKLLDKGIELPNDVFELDLQARNTKDNIEYILKMMEKTIDREYKSLLYVISTDYHIDRLEKIDILLPQNGSLIARINKSGINYKFLRSKYRYLSDEDEIKRWQAKLYLDAENFKIMESNLVSLINEEVDELSKHIVDYFPKNLDKIEETLGKMIGTKKTKNCKVDEILEKVYPCLSELRNFYIDIINFISKSDNKTKNNEWKNRHEIFKKLIRGIITTVDPDEPFNNFYEN